MMIDKLEAERIKLQANLDSKKSSLERNQLGQFATPSPLAFDLLAHAHDLLPKNSKIRFLDPALGSGAFYAALRRVFKEDEILEARGFEIDPHYGMAAEQLWANEKLQITHADFTLSEPKPAYDLIICNPPYVRHHHIQSENKRLLIKKSEKIVGEKLSGLAGLYVHFLLQCHAWMAPGATAGWLIPSEFMDVNYGRVVKRYLLEKVTLLQIHRFSPDDVQFADALVSSSIVWIKNEIPDQNHQPLFTFGGSLSAPAIKKKVSRADLVCEDKWTRFPRLEVRPIKLAGTQLLGDLFTIKRGLATGNNDFFVLNEARVQELGIPMSALRPILPSPRYVPSDEITATSNGLPTNVERLFLLDPQLNEETIYAEHPSLYRYLHEGEAINVRKGYICRNRKRWYDQEKRPPAPIVCTYMGRSDAKDGRPFRFIRNRSDATVANSYLAMYPTLALQKRLDSDPGLLDMLWQQMNQITAESLLEEGRVYGGGLHKLEPKELAKVPLNLG